MVPPHRQEALQKAGRLDLAVRESKIHRVASGRRAVDLDLHRGGVQLGRVSD